MTAPTGQFNYQLSNAFRDSYLLPWYATVSSPHLAFDNTNNNGSECQLFGFNPVSDPAPFNCIASKSGTDGVYMEGIGQGYSFVADGFRSYCITGQVRSLSCIGGLASRLEFRAANNLVLVEQYTDPISPPSPPGNDVQLIGVVNVPFNPTAVTNFSLPSYSPNFNYSQFEIVSVLNGNVLGNSNASFNNISLQCDTWSLTGLDPTINDFTVDFDAINGSNVNYQTYAWDFGDGNTSTDAMPSNTYAIAGTYNVCLDIVDVNGCCGSLCQDVIIPPVDECTPTTQNFIYLDGNSTNNSLSDLVANEGYSPTEIITNTEIIVNGNFIFDESMVFRNCDFYFGPGAGITARSNGFTRILSSTLEGCDLMWKGITVEGTGEQNRFQISNSTISDAFRAIELLDGASVILGGNTYDRNYVGVYSPAQNTQKTIYGASITRSNFTCTDNLKSPYPNQPAWSEITYAGVLLKNVANFDIVDFEVPVIGGGSPPIRNNFEGIKNGVIYDNVNINIENNMFSTMQLENGYGVRGRQCNNSSIVLNDFVNVNQPIHLSNSINSNILIEENEISENNQSVAGNFGMVQKQIFINQVDASEIIVDNNTLSADQVQNPGILVLDCNSLNRIHVVNNELKWNERNMAIWLDNVHKVQGAEGIVAGNYTTQEGNGSEMKSSISLRNTDNFIVSNNDIKTMSEQGQAFNFANSKKCLIEGNIATMANSTNSWLPRLYDISNSPGNIYCCNTANNGRRGFYFRGENNASELRSSIFNNTTIGLWLQNATIGEQVLYGNYWTNTNGSTRAVFYATLGEDEAYENSIFYVNPSQTGTRPDIASPSAWFSNVGGQASLCGSNNSDPTCGSSNWDGFNIVTPNPNEDPCELFKEELTALVDTTEYWDFQNQYDWVLYTYLLDRYRDSSLDTLGDCFPIPEKNVNVKTVAKYYKADRQYKEAYQSTVSESIELDSLQNLLESDLDSLSNLFESFESDDDYNINITQVIALQNQISQLSNAINNINHTINIRGINSLQSLLTQVNLLPSDFYFHDELKYIWNIKIQIALHGIGFLSTNQWDEIERIGNECVLEYGTAVLEAQSVLNYIGVRDFDDELSCQGLTPRQSIESDHSINVYPNPSSGMYTLELSDAASTITKVKVYNLNGMLVFSETMNSRESNQNVDISDNQSGVYYLEVVQSDGTAYYEKLILIK